MGGAAGQHEDEGQSRELLNQLVGAIRRRMLR
jgi:hypothetical protein